MQNKETDPYQQETTLKQNNEVDDESKFRTEMNKIFKVFKILKKFKNTKINPQLYRK